MAINKNFVIKNGVQVDTDLIVGDSNTKKVGIGTTIPGYTLHVGATNSAGRGGIGATDAVITGVGTIKDLLVSGAAGFSSSVSVTGIVSAYSFGIGSTEVIDRGFRLSGISSLDSTTIATIEEAIRVGPNSFSDLKVSGISTFVGIATFLGGIDVNIRSGVSTFSAPVQFGFAQYDAAAGLSSNFVAVGATVGFGTSAFFRDNAAIFMGDASDFKLYHDNTNSYIDNMTGALYVRNSVDDDDNSSIIFQAKSGENSIVMTNSADESNEVELYYDGVKKLQTTSGGLYVTGITTLSDRLYVESGISTFVNDVRFGIGATVGFGTSAFFLDDAAITIGDDDDFFIKHSGGHTYLDNRTGHIYVRNSVSSDINTSIIFQAKSGENSIVMTNSADESNEVELYYDGAKKLQTTSGGVQITGITTLTNRLHVQAGVSTFDADVRFGIGATVGFGTSAFFLDEASIFMGDSDDFELFHDGTDSVIRNRTGDLKLLINNTENGIVIKDNEGVEAYFDNSKKTETTSGGFKVTGITTLTDRLHVQSGISTFDADVRYGIGATVGFGTSAFFRDDAAIFLGNDSDLRIFHGTGASGVGNYIEDFGTGKLYIRSNEIGIKGVTTNEPIANFTENGSVELYFDNSKKVETTSGGLNVTGITTFSDRINVVSGVSTFQDSAKLTFGAQSDLIVWHNGSHSYIQDTTGTGNLYVDSNNLVIRNAAGDETQATFVENGGVSLYYDDSKKLESTSGGLNVTGITTFSDRINVVSGISTFQDNAQLAFGSQLDLIVWHDGTDSRIQNGTGELEIIGDDFDIRSATGDKHYLSARSGVGVTIFYNNTKRLETISTGATVTGDLWISGDLYVADDIVYDEIAGRNLKITGVGTFYDDAPLYFGDSQDLKVWHSSSDNHTRITESGSGNLLIQGAHIHLQSAAGDETFATFTDDGAVSLYYDNGNVFQTTPQGVNVSGVTTTNRLIVSGISTFTGIIDGNGGANISGGSGLVASTAKISDLTDNRVVIAGSSGELEDDANLTFDGVKLNVGSGVTIYPHGGAAFAGIVTVGGNLNVQGDIVYDEITGRNLNITGISTQAGQANFGTSGVGATIAANGNASFSGVVTATEYYHQGTHLSAGVGIGSTTGHVGYGFTYINFKGPGVSTCYADIRAGYTGFATVTFQGGGLSGAAGTWAPYGDSGIATSKAVGVGTVGMAVTSLQGGQKGASSGVGNSFRGLYIGNGMMVVDNELNGNHYIGTSYNGLMAGPVTINGYLTVDGNYVVV